MNLIEYGEGPVKIGSNLVQTKQYLILDYASKGEIFDYMICVQKGLSERHAKFMFKKILEGVQSCHLSGICHRDLKLQNILLDDDFNPKICDFGFATELKGKDGRPVFFRKEGKNHRRRWNIRRWNKFFWSGI